jgi:ABC-type transporter Mla subunit MlaD
MSAIDNISRLRQAKNADQIAQEIEPLAQALAALSDELKGVLEALKETATSTRGTLETGTNKLHDCIQTATNQAQETGQLFKGLIQEQKKTAWKFSAGMLVLTILASLTGGAVAASAWRLWLKPSQAVEAGAQRWNETVTTYNGLEPTKKRQFRELMGWPEPKGEATGRSKR